MNQKKCLKCGHVATYESHQPDACPACGAIYRKVEEAAAASQNGAPAKTRNSGFGPSVMPSRASQMARSPKQDLEWFVDDMRSNSLYPTWRELVKWATWFGYLIATLMLLGGLLGVVQGNVKAGVAAMVGGLMVAIIARVWRELSLMVADLADSAVRQAARNETSYG